MPCNEPTSWVVGDREWLPDAMARRVGTTTAPHQLLLAGGVQPPHNGEPARRPGVGRGAAAAAHQLHDDALRAAAQHAPVASRGPAAQEQNGPHHETEDGDEQLLAHPAPSSAPP